MRGRLLAAGLAFWATSAVHAADRWEAAAYDSPDTENVLRHGVVQTHDLESAGAAADQDWMRIVCKPRHSYELSVRGLRWGCSGAGCAQLLVQNSSGTPVAAGSQGGDDVGLPDGSSLGARTAFSSNAGAVVLVRVLGWTTATAEASSYDIQLRDTTLFVPRWNNTATQTTVLVLQNTANHEMGGRISFHDADGALLTFVDVLVPQHGVHLLQTASIAALQGRSGSATIAQAPYAALVGKAVALEPATGFTFDTTIVPLPY
jgi:hypothetical protein